MLGAIYIGLSGMNAYSKGLQTISNNVANLNSPGFKTTSISFTDMFSYGGGGLTYSTGTRDEQAGSGVRYGEPRIDFRQGDLRQSNGDLDLAIQGNGFLVLLDGDKTFYTRTGQFVVDEEGYISLQGTKQHLAVLGEDRQPVALNLDAKRTNPPKATTRITLAENLNASSSSTTGEIVSNIAVYDPTGKKQVWQLKFEKTSTPSEWTIKVTDQTGAAVGGTDTQPLTIKFSPGGFIDPTTAQKTIMVSAAFSVALDLSAITSFSGPSTTLRASSVDGNGVGALTSVTVNEEGKVKLVYSNEEEEILGAVALADFRDPQQLERAGNGLFENTGGAEHRLLSSNTDGIGKLVSKQVEASNVDLAQEFGDLILIQRGFQASSQVVSVSNDMIQQLFGIRGQG